MKLLGIILTTSILFSDNFVNAKMVKFEIVGNYQPKTENTKIDKTNTFSCVDGKSGVIKFLFDGNSLEYAYKKDLNSIGKEGREAICN